MKIRHKLAFSYLISGTFILLLFSAAIYLFSANYRHREFEKRLRERVVITEKMLLEKDNFTAGELEKIRTEFLHILPEEKEEVIHLEEGEVKVDHPYPEDFIGSLLQEGEASFETGRVQGAGKFFHLQGEDFLVIVTAVDISGYRKLDNLKWIIGISLLSGIVLFSLISIPLSSHFIKPLSYKIRMANMISASNLHQRLSFNSNDEIGELASAFNNLLDRLQKAFEAKKSFISNASHEIRSPLTAIINETDIALEKERSSGEYQQALQSISQEAERMKLLVDNLLQLSKISDAGIPLKFEYLNLYQLIKEAAHRIQYADYSNEIVFEAGDNPKIKSLGCWGNKHLLHTVVINILDNACKFSAGRTVSISLSVKNQNALIEISDSGIGISAGEIGRITEAFYRAPEARHIKGSGIGLTLVSRILDIHHGTLRVQSEGSGTRVSIELPTEEPIDA